MENIKHSSTKKYLSKAIRIGLWNIGLVFLCYAPLATVRVNSERINDFEMTKVLMIIWLLSTLYQLIRELVFEIELNKDKVVISSENFIEIKKSELRDFTQRLFNSREYFDVLTSTLPKGGEDKEYGVDYIPFILDSLREKKLSFQRTSNIFLGLTIALAVTFSSVLIYYGNILVNDDSAGLNRSFKELRVEMPRLLNDLENFKRRELIDNQINTDALTALNKINMTIDSVRSTANTSKFLTLLDLIPNESSTQSIYDLPKISSSYQPLIVAFESLASQSQERLKPMDSLIMIVKKNTETLDEATIRFNNVLSLYELRLSEQAQIIPQLSTQFDQIKGGQFSTNEILKRLAIALIIATFLLTILRFSANLYRRNFAEQVQAENDGLNIRKLYIAFKNVKDDQSRSIVLDSLLRFNRNPFEADFFESSTKFDLNKLIDQLIRFGRKSI